MSYRKVELERKLASIPNESKEREIRKYHRLESQHLRLKRTKIKLDDFRTVKIIGKGAFGEVCQLLQALKLTTSSPLI
jgi:protein-serine/threonine kinase